MGEPSVVGTRENEVAHAQLLDSPQALKLLGIDETQQQPIPRPVLKRDDVMDRIADHLGPFVAHRNCASAAQILGWLDLAILAQGR